MSIKVALEELSAEIEQRGPGYLLTTVDGGRPHVMHLRFEPSGTADDGAPVLTTPVGRSARRNIDAVDTVTLLFPPIEEGGYSLIVDATATVTADGEGPDATLLATITPVDAVLHRPA